MGFLDRTPIFVALTLLCSSAQAALQPAPGGALLDTATGLAWDPCLLGRSGDDCSGGATTLLDWANALQAVRQANAEVHRGYTDWRLPNRSELESLLREDASALPGEAHLWTSTSDASDPSRAWQVGFPSGASARAGKDTNAALRLVRGGRGAAAYAQDDLPPVFTRGPEVTPDIDATTAQLRLAVSEDATLEWHVEPLSEPSRLRLRAGVETLLPIQRLLPGRTYTVEVEVTDVAGNSTLEQVRFETPHVGRIVELPSGSRTRLTIPDGFGCRVRYQAPVSPGSLPPLPAGLALAATPVRFNYWGCVDLPVTVQMLYSPALPQEVEVWRYGRSEAGGTEGWYPATGAVGEPHRLQVPADDGVAGLDDDQTLNGQFWMLVAPVALANEIDFVQPPAQTVRSSFTAIATATSGQPVRFDSMTPLVCSIDADSGLTDLHRPGTCTLQASQGVTGAHVAAEPVQRSFEVVGAQVDLQVGIDDGRSHVRDGDRVWYRIGLHNAGSDPATAVRLQDTLPYALVDAQWQCLQKESGIACPSPADGSGGLDVSLELPAGATVVYELAATVRSDGASSITYAVNAFASEADLDESDNTASDENLIAAPPLFSDGFEPE